MGWIARWLRGGAAAAVLGTIALTGCAREPDTGAASLNLGEFHRTVTTSSPDAQAWFDRGLALVYGFNHEEAVRCFERAAWEDPSCAMAQWGIAYASGIHINNPVMSREASRTAYDAARRARRLAPATGWERDLIDALQTRYAWPAPSDRAALDRAYADAMRGVYAAHPNDPDVAALFAESMMDLRPWKQWSKSGEPEEGTAEIVRVLEGGLAVAPRHPALCHFYIHAVEASPNPGRALPAADALRLAVPDSGHLVHMPSHIDVLLGRYEECIAANQRAVEADTKYLALRGPNNFYTLYRAHNQHFIVYGAMLSGKRTLALRAADDLVQTVPAELVIARVDELDGFMATPLHAMVRFGMWEEILAEPAPDARLPMTTALWRYARGVALAATGRAAEAAREREAFEAARALVPSSSIMFNNTSRDVLAIASAMLEGEVMYREGRHAEAFEKLREAVRLDDALNYDEPWGWMQPARHALGALLLEQGRVSEAAEVYREDLKRHPDNVWALHGLSEALARGGNSAADAAELRRRLERAQALADAPVTASCYCRTGAHPGG